MNRTTATPQRSAQDEAITLIRREIEDIDSDLSIKREFLSNTASEIGKLETRRRRMNRVLVMTGGEAA